jgi:AcrR family transcriptional regulator
MAVLSHGRAEQGRGRLEPEAAFVLATAILLDEGIPYADLSVEQIARKAGRSRSTFYVYFRDKRELLLHATQEIAERLYAAAAGWLREPGGDGDVHDALAGILSIYREHPGLLAAVVEASGYDELVREHWRELMGGFVEATERRLVGDELLTEGEISTASVHAQAFALVWMTERVCYQQLTGGGVRVNGRGHAAPSRARGDGGTPHADLQLGVGVDAYSSADRPSSPCALARSAGGRRSPMRTLLPPARHRC